MNEPDHQQLSEALRRLREDAAGKNAPEALENALLDAFRRHHTAGVHKRKKGLAWISALGIAASIAVAVAVHISAPAGALQRASASLSSDRNVRQSGSGSSTRSNADSLEPRISSAPAATNPLQKKSPARPRRAVTRQYAKTVPPPSLTRPPQDPFIQIPYAPAFTPYEEAQVVRVKMPGASVRQLGLPVTTERVDADLLLGNDGIARGIRLVSNSGFNSYR